MINEQHKISNDRIEPNKGIDTEKTKPQQPDKSLFQSYMQEGAPNAPKTTPGASPAEVTGLPAMQTAGPSVDSLLGQVNTSQANMDNIRDKLNTPDLKFKRQHQYLLRDKLTEANNHLASANTRLGAGPISPTEVADNAGPVEKFLAYVTDGQNQLLAAKSQLESLKSQGTQINPADMLLVQVKLSQAQQELEYSSTLLSKVVDMFKQMLNIQL